MARSHVPEPAAAEAPLKQPKPRRSRKPAELPFENPKLDPAERRQEAIARRLAELLAQKDWRLLEAGRALHDDIGQILTAAGIRCDLLAGQIAGIAPELAEESATLQSLLEQCLQRVRHLSGDLNRATADRLGLKAAIDRLIERWEPGIRARVYFHCPADIKLALGPSRIAVRLAEFALELAANRVQCKKVLLKLRTTAKGCTVTAEVWSVGDPITEPESEVAWRILKASAALAGAEVTLGVAFKTEDVTIMKGEFPT